MRARRYYAHPQNLFWRLAGELTGRADLTALDYEKRLEALLSRGVGLWDTVISAERIGSLDAAIRAAEHAPLADLVAALPELRAIGFNGKTSARIGRPQLVGTPLVLVDLPSSSPAHAAMAYAEKRERWIQLKQFLA